MNSSRRGAVYGFKLESLSKVRGPNSDWWPCHTCVITLSRCTCIVDRYQITWSAADTPQLHCTCCWEGLPSCSFFLRRPGHQWSLQRLVLVAMYNYIANHVARRQNHYGWSLIFLLQSQCKSFRKMCRRWRMAWKLFTSRWRKKPTTSLFSYPHS